MILSSPTAEQADSEQNYRVGWTIDGVYTEYGAITSDSINKSHGGSVDKYLHESGIKYGYFTDKDTTTKKADIIYGVNGNLYDPNTVTPPLFTPPVISGCTEGTTRTAICPKNGKLIMKIPIEN